MHDGWHGAPRFPRPLHHGRQEVLGNDCEVLVMQVPRTAPQCLSLCLSLCPSYCTSY